MKRFAASIAAAALALLVLAAGIGAARRSLAEWGIAAALRSARWPAFEFEVEEVGWGRLRLRAIRGLDGELEAERVELRWSGRGLAARRLASVEIDGLSLQARLDTGGGSFGALDPWLAGLREGGPPRSSDVGAELARVVPLDRIRVRDARISIETPAGSIAADGGADLALRPRPGGEASLGWRGPDASAGELRARIDHTGVLQGRLRVALERSLLAGWAPASASALPERLELQLDGGGDLSGLASGSAEPVDLELALDAHARDGAIGGARVAGPLRVRWQPDALLVSLPECLALSLPSGAEWAGVVLTAPAAVCLRSDAAEPIRLALSGAAGADLRLDAAAPELALRVGGPAGRRYRARALRAELRLKSGAEPSLRIDGERVVLSDPALALRGVRVDASWRASAGSPLTGRFRIDRLDDAAGGFPPLAGAGRFEIAERRVRFDARARDAAGELRARIEGAHRPADGSGGAELHFEPLRFAAGRGVPAALGRWWPSELRVEEGEVGAVARLRWGAAGLAAEADLSIAGVALATASGMRVDGVDTEIGLASLVPPATRGVQKLRFRSASLGVPLRRGRVAYALGSDRVLRIEDARIGVAGGRLGVKGVLDLAGGPGQRLELRLRDLELPALLDLAPVEGLEASGRLRGELLLTVEDGRPVLHGGAIHAVDGGRIRYRPAAAAASAEPGRDVGAMVRAILDDFHYEVLALTLQGWLDEGLQVQAELRGHNPSFQDGHPVHLTLNLSTAFAEAIDALPELRGWLAWLAERERATPDAKRLH